jgi:hypothetical protein
VLDSPGEVILFLKVSSEKNIPDSVFFPLKQIDFMAGTTVAIGICIWVL